MKTGKWNHIDGQFAEISIQLTWEPEASCNPRHGGRDKMVQVAICGCCQLECAEADVIEGFVVNAEGLISVLNQLVDRESSIVGFNNCVRYLQKNVA